ncbi:MAG: hypothetical protein RBS05_21260 [Zoogloea oleivorans]|jgi:hypothetical protein|uniref:hypothetical protein n=1 Tax=Zoogloea oleivorans TaxID=1552750 RepID=UPI002A35A859|nr:hypothetical protein [Zoogloea oleivorans]MDY0038443.1 hypothetical protein [Zoogloea oleivorans]
MKRSSIERQRSGTSPKSTHLSECYYQVCRLSILKKLIQMVFRKSLVIGKKPAIVASWLLSFIVAHFNQ